MKRLIAVAATVLALGAGAWYFLWGRTPEPPDAASAAPEAVRAYLASDHFAKLPGERQAQYMEALASQPAERMRALGKVDGMPKAEQERLMDNVQRGFLRVMAKQAQEYAALPADRREAYLDEKMAEMMSRMQAMRAMQPSGEGARAAGPPMMMGGRMNADQIQRHMEQMLSRTTPRERAQLERYGNEIRRRMMARMGMGLFR